MVKTICKYLKFLMCMVLIMGLIVPSYAANTASDGSAFVTKEEFDKALADFNARLTTFEAGINSKIDSQVSSYLDRNGIWNGAPQTFYNYASVYDWYSELSWVQANKEYTDETGTHIERVRSIMIDNFMDDFELHTYTGGHTFKIGDPTTTLSSSSTYVAIPNSGSYVKTVKIIDKCTKSGLMFLNWMGRDSARLAGQASDSQSTGGRRGTWLGDVAYNNGNITSFTNQSKYNTLKTYWQVPLATIATRATGASSLSGWGAVVTPAYIDAWSSFQLSEKVKFHTGYNSDKTGVDAVENLGAEQLLWNYTLQYNSPQIYPYPNWWAYGQYRIGLNGDAVKYTNLFFVQKDEPVYLTIVFTISGRTPHNAARLLAAGTDHGHFAGTAFMLDANVY